MITALMMLARPAAALRVALREEDFGMGFIVARAEVEASKRKKHEAPDHTGTSAPA